MSRYPLSSAQGMPIPLEIKQPLTSYVVSYPAAAMAAPLAVFQADFPDIVQVWVTEDALVGTLATPVDKGALDLGVEITTYDDSMILKADELYNLVIPAQYLSFCGLHQRGLAYISLLETWDTIAQANFIGRG